MFDPAKPAAARVVTTIDAKSLELDDAPPQCNGIVQGPQFLGHELGLASFLMRDSDEIRWVQSREILQLGASNYVQEPRRHIQEVIRLGHRRISVQENLESDEGCLFWYCEPIRKTIEALRDEELHDFVAVSRFVERLGTLWVHDVLH
jgi:hypothetical protein